MGPVGSLCEWFEQTPEDVQEDLAFWLWLFLPGVDVSGDPWPPAAVLAHMRSTTGPREAGMALAVAALVDFHLDERDSPDDWRRAMVQQDNFVKEARARGYDSIAKFAEQKRAVMPFDSRQWIQSAEKWKALRAGALSPAAIGKWLTEAMRDAAHAAY